MISEVHHKFFSHSRQSTVGGIKERVRGKIILRLKPFPLDHPPKSLDYVKMRRIWRELPDNYNCYKFVEFTGVLSCANGSGRENHFLPLTAHPCKSPQKSMSPTSTNRSPRLRPTDVGDSDLEAVKAHYKQLCLTARFRPSSEGQQGQVFPN